MKNVNTTSQATLAALAAAVIAGTPAAQSQTGGVAVLEAPAASAPRAPRVRKPKTPIAITPEVTGDVSVEISDMPVDNEAAPAGGAGAPAQDELGLQPGTRTILRAIGDQKVGRGSKISKKERQAVYAAALDMIMALGLGETNQVNKESVGFGPLTRVVFIRLIKANLQKLDPTLKTVKIEHLNESNLRAVLTMPDLTKAGHSTLDLYLGELELNATKKNRIIAAATVKTRNRNAKLARRFLDSGVAKELVTALDAIVQLGREVRYGQVRMPLDRAVGVALGRSIGAAELFKSDDREIVADTAAE